MFLSMLLIVAATTERLLRTFHSRNIIRVRKLVNHISILLSALLLSTVPLHVAYLPPFSVMSFVTLIYAFSSSNWLLSALPHYSLALDTHDSLVFRTECLSHPLHHDRTHHHTIVSTVSLGWSMPVCSLDWSIEREARSAHCHRSIFSIFSLPYSMDTVILNRNVMADQFNVLSVFLQHHQQPAYVRKIRRVRK